MATFLQLLPHDVVVHELAPILAKCERPLPPPPRVTIPAKITMTGFGIGVLILVVVVVCFAWPTQYVSERSCVPFLCDWITASVFPNDGCGYCDNNTTNCFWTPTVNGYVASMPWGMGIFGYWGSTYVCPPARNGLPAAYYSANSPQLNGSICYKPSDDCTGEDWITKYVDGGYCSPILDCEPYYRKSYKNSFARIIFIIVSSIVVTVVSITIVTVAHIK